MRAIGPVIASDTDLGDAYMTSSIVASILDSLTPEITGKLAAAAGLDRFLTEEAINAGVPAILNSVADLVTKPAGARKLMSAVSEQSGDFESIISNLIGPAQAATAGNHLLSSLLGGRTPNILASGIANLLGVRINAVQTLLGLLAPLVLGGLRRVQSAGGLDAEGLARMLTEQKQSIADEIPVGLSNYLRKSGVIDDGSRPRQAPRPEEDRPVPATIAKTLSVSNGAKSVAWPYWLLAIVALGGLLWTLLPREEDGLSDTAAVTNTRPDRSMLVPEPGTRVAYIVRPEGGWRSIGTTPNEYVNAVVYNARGEPLGTVRDLMVEQDGKAAAAVISVGRYLGIGDKVVAVPFPALRIEQRDSGRRIVIDLTKEALQGAPQYENAASSK